MMERERYLEERTRIKKEEKNCDKTETGARWVLYTDSACELLIKQWQAELKNKKRDRYKAGWHLKGSLTTTTRKTTQNQRHVVS
jgi:hypothetical protein